MNPDCSLKLKSPKQLKDYTYVLAKGILSEVSPYYMTTYRDFLREQGVPAHNILMIGTASYIKPEQGARDLATRLIAHRQRPLILIGHSKGALEILYYLHGQTNLKHVAKAFLINGPLDGASLYQLAYGNPQETTLATDLLKNVIDQRFSDSFDAQVVRRHLQGLEGNEELIKKSVFIQSDTTFDNVPLKYKLPANLYRKVYGKVGDGLLMTRDHLPYALREHQQVCRMTLNVYHDELTKAFPWEKERRQRIAGFLTKLLL